MMGPRRRSGRSAVPAASRGIVITSVKEAGKLAHAGFSGDPHLAPPSAKR
jgi:hypothetical protein